MQTNDTQRSEELQAHLWDKRSAARHRAWCEFRYHRRRERFFDLCDKGTKAVTVLLGAALFGPKVQAYAPWVGTAVAAAGLMPLIFSYSDRKRLHQDLAAEAGRLAQSIEGTTAADVTLDTLAAWQAALAGLDAKAPPPLKALMQLCDREQGVADGHPDHLKDVAPTGWRARLAQFI